MGWQPGYDVALREASSERPCTACKVLQAQHTAPPRLLALSAIVIADTQRVDGGEQSTVPGKLSWRDPEEAQTIYRSLAPSTRNADSYQTGSCLVARSSNGVSLDIKTVYSFDTVLAEKRKCLAERHPHAISSNAVTVDCSVKRLIQILDFGEQKKPPFVRLSISDSKTKIISRLSDRARIAIKDATGRNPSSQAEGAICELIHYSLIFDSAATDEVIVDIHELVYKEGACMPPIGKPRRIEGQKSSQSSRDMAFSSIGNDSLAQGELETSEVLSQTQLMSDTGMASSEDEGIATQIPRNKSIRGQSHHVGREVTLGPGGLLNLLESHGRKAAIKRPSSVNDDPPPEVRSSKRRHIEQSVDSAPSPTAEPNDEQDESSFDKRSASIRMTEGGDTVLVDTASHPESSPALTSGHQISSTTGRARCHTGDDHNTKAIADHFYIGLKTLPKKFVTPPMDQLRYLAHHARYIDPRLPTESQSVGVSHSVAQELRTLTGSVATATESRSEDAIEQTLKHDTAKINGAAAADADVAVAAQYEDVVYGHAQDDEGHSEVSDATNVSWPPSPVRQFRGNKDHVAIDQVSCELNSGKLSGEYADNIHDDEEPEGSPSRLPPLKKAGAADREPAPPAGRTPGLVGQVPSSSLSIDYELEQQVPVPLDPSDQHSQMSLRSPSPASRIIPPSGQRSPVVQIGGSPHLGGIKREAKNSLLRPTASRNSRNTRMDGIHAVSSNPVIPATCADSQETTRSANGGQGQAPKPAPSIMQSEMPSNASLILVPATIPAKSNTSTNLKSALNKGESAVSKLDSTRCSATPHPARKAESQLQSASDAPLEEPFLQTRGKDTPESPQSKTLAHVSPSGATVFDKFKLTYPQFRHDRSKFIMACTYIKWLRDYRKVMPLHQSLFDDFIRVFCGPYSEYVRDQSANGLSTETPVDFYNGFLEPEFTCRIVTLATLAKALESNSDLAAKHSKRLRRISSKFIARSASITTEQQGPPDMDTSASHPTRQASFIDLEPLTGHDLHNQSVRKSSPILGEPAPTGPVEQGTTRNTQLSEALLNDRREKEQARESEKALASRPLSAALITPKVSARTQFLTLTLPNGTPSQIPSTIDPVEAKVMSEYVPRQRKRVRSRYSLPGRGSHE